MVGFFNVYDPIDIEFSLPPWYYCVNGGTLIECTDRADVLQRGVLEINVHCILILLSYGLYLLSVVGCCCLFLRLIIFLPQQSARTKQTLFSHISVFFYVTSVQ